MIFPSAKANCIFVVVLHFLSFTYTHSHTGLVVWNLKFWEAK